MINIKNKPLIVYFLEWGVESSYCTSEYSMQYVYSTVEVACSHAMEWKGNIPEIIQYDIENHIVLKRYNAKELDEKLGSLIS